MKIFLYLLLLNLPISAHAEVIPKHAKSLIKEFTQLNEICLNDDAEKPEIASACDKRDSIYGELKTIGWCFSPYNLPFEVREWMSCKKATTPERVRIFSLARNKRFVTGDTISPPDANFRLYLDKPCKLPVENANNMHYFYLQVGRFPRIGCWYPTLDDGYVILYGNGTAETQPSWEMLPRASLNSDGSATITEQDYDSETAVKKFMDSRVEKQLKMLRQGAY
jgi:hypothetical protein